MRLVVDTDALLSEARSRLKISGTVTIQAVPQSEAVSPEFGLAPALTASNEDASKHEIRYVADRVNDVDLFHELCHVKLNEIGFRKVEVAIEHKTICWAPGQEQEEMNKAAIFGAEAYANSLLFKYFRKESESLMISLDQRFLLAQSIRILVQKLGSNGIAQTVIHRISKKWSGYNDDDAFKWAFEQAFKGKRQLRDYTEIHSIMSKLPVIREFEGQIQNFKDANINSIEECTVELFKNLDGRRLRNR